MADDAITRLEGGRRLREAPSNRTPLVSIVSVVFNAANELLPLLESIVAHRGDETELIVVDGGSQDGSVEILRRFESEIDYWVSEPDRGIYDAMNKGISLARGNYILHLNAGDRLIRIPRKELLGCLADGVDLASFAVDMEGFGLHWPRSSRFLARFSCVWHHQGSFYLRENHLGYDTQFVVHADFDLNQRMVLCGKSIRCFKDITVSGMGIGGISSSMQHVGEVRRLITKNFGIVYAAMAFALAQIMRAAPLIKWMRGTGPKTIGKGFGRTGVD